MTQQDYRDKFGADTRDVNEWPYSPSIYLRRALWLIVHKTIWKICPAKIRALRCMIIRVFGGKIPLNVAMNGSTFIEMPWDVSIGEHVAMGPRVNIYNLGGVEIGAHAVLSQDVYLCGGTHDYTDPRYPLLRQKIVIGSYAWIAAGAFIAPGITVGEGAVVGARAVVIHDVEPWTIVAGNPAKFIKQREMKKVNT